MLIQLMKLGLSEKEAKVYLAALELGASTAQQIARKAGVNRATTYVILQALMRQGLTSTFTKGKKTYFAAEPPEELDHLLRKQEEDIFEQRRDLEKMIPELKALFNLSDEKPKVRFFEGRDGVQVMIEEVYRHLPAVTAISEFLALDELRGAMPSYESITAKQRVKKQITTRVIYTHKDGEQSDVTDKATHRTAHFLSADTYPFEASILIVPDSHQVVISSYRRGYSGVVIENPELARTLQSLFNVTWNAFQSRRKR